MSRKLYYPTAYCAASLPLDGGKHEVEESMCDGKYTG